MGSGGSSLDDGGRTENWSKTWDLVVVCGGNAVLADVFVEQLQARKQLGRLSSDCRVLQCTSDSAVEGLMTATSFLMENEPDTDLSEMRALILTLGPRQHFSSPITSSLSVLLPGDNLVSLADFLIDSLGASNVGVPAPGMWVINADSILVHPPRLDDPRFSTESDVQVFNFRLGEPGHSDNYYRIIYDPISKEVENIFPPQETVQSEQAEEDDFVCGLVHVNLALCEEIVDLVLTLPLSDTTTMSLFDDVLEALSTNTTLESYESSSRSRLADTMKNRLFKAIHDRFNVQVVETKTSLFCSKTIKEYRDLHTRLFPVMSRSLDKLGYVLPDEGFGAAEVSTSYVQTETAEMDAFAARRRASSSVANRSEAGYRPASDSLGTEFSAHSSRLRSRSRSAVDEGSTSIDGSAQTINSLLLGSGVVCADALIENCRLAGKSWSVGQGAVCIGLRSRTRNIRVPSNVFMQEVALLAGPQGPSTISIMYHVDDALDTPAALGGTFMSLPWSALLQRTGISPGELWDSDDQTALLRNAKLFPVGAKDANSLELARYYLHAVLSQQHLLGSADWAHVSPFILYVARRAWKDSTRLSLRDIESQMNLSAELEWRTKLSFRVDEFRLADWLLADSGQEVLIRGKPIIERMAKSGYTQIFDTMDSIICNRAHSPSLVKQTLACLGDALVVFAAAIDPEVSVDEAREGEDTVLESHRLAVFNSMPRVEDLAMAVANRKGLSRLISKMASVRRSLLEQDTLKKVKAAIFIYLAEYYSSASEKSTLR